MQLKIVVKQIPVKLFDKLNIAIHQFAKKQMTFFRRMEKRNIKNKSGKDESIFLRSIENTLLNKETKASKTIKDFNEKKGIDFFYE